jgi:hypothetical protein
MLPTVLAAALVPCAFCCVDRSCVPMLMPPPLARIASSGSRQMFGLNF